MLILCNLSISDPSHFFCNESVVFLASDRIFQSFLSRFDPFNLFVAIRFPEEYVALLAGSFTGETCPLRFDAWDALLATSNSQPDETVCQIIVCQSLPSEIQLSCAFHYCDPNQANLT
jgi:hypothetical protein